MSHLHKILGFAWTTDGGRPAKHGRENHVGGLQDELQLGQGNPLLLRY